MRIERSLFVRETTQINITIPKAWKKRLEGLARADSMDDVSAVSYVDLIRRAIEKTYDMNDELTVIVLGSRSEYEDAVASDLAGGGRHKVPSDDTAAFTIGTICFNEYKEGESEKAVHYKYVLFGDGSPAQDVWCETALEWVRIVHQATSDPTKACFTSDDPKKPAVGMAVWPDNKRYILQVQKITPGCRDAVNAARSMVSPAMAKFYNGV